MSKVVFLGDTHFGYRIDNNAYTNHVKKFYTEFFFPYLKANKIDTIIQFGDLMDNRRHVSIKTLRFIKEVFLDPMKKAKIKMHTFLGNHDIYYKNTNDLNSPAYVLQGYKNVKLYQTNTDVEIGGRLFGMVPWINEENMSLFEKYINMTEAKTICGHFEFGGFEYVKGVTSDRGMGTKQFTRFEDVYSGHYHITSSKGNITYLGTPYEMTFNDLGDPKGLWVYDTDDASIEQITSPHILFRKIIYDDTTVDYDTYDFTIYKESYVRVYVIKRDNMAMYSRFIDNLYNAEAIDINVLEKDLDFDDDDVDVETQSTIDIMRDTVSSLTNVDQSGIITILDNLYREATLMGNE